ncbi:hypothetical protein KC340_g17421 [Hortaea werneckii]|nr:hypothetical protein KC342_g17011 [Hortaea werneckii]KAI7059090.1 hypothetical protein KC339_g17442 [Hortaea werneckii]KAI7207131.1 hypothetical protein KC365_g16739 [Hortaea werneckii]KAI7290384.1 hypothetical protein KC340_g17421 [Hortaea werneckii]KAI7377692.1 hypothetical protein KC328_g14300 [Hortaea werneckii]
MSSTSSRSLTSSLEKLNLSETSKTAPDRSKAQPADSWEDEADDGQEAGNDSGVRTPVQQVTSSELPQAPPPTPASPSYSSSKTSAGTPYQTFPPYGFDGTSGEQSSSGENSPAPRVRSTGEEKRPEKSTAVASRLIAAGIGQKAPRRTKEQREYDQAMKVQEKKRRDQAKEEEGRRKAEKEKAKAAIWDD